jgi:DNA-binding transcriptional LysR family regulator
MKHVTLRQLTIFESLARHLSFSRAAEELHLTQPAVSMQVQNLEDLAGLPLTEQIGKRIRLTAAGEEVARLSQRISQQLRETDESLLAMKGAQGGRLLIGVVSTAKYFAPTLLAEFKRRHPGIELRLSVNNRSAVIRQLAENEIDIAIMGTPPNEFETIAEVFSEHPLVFIAAPDHPLTKKKKISPATLSGETLLFREAGSGTRRALEAYLEEAKVVPREVMEMGSNETLKQSVMAGLGIAFISAHTIGLELSVKRLHVLDVLGTPLKRQWHLVHRAEKRLLPAGDAFRKFIRSDARQLMTQAAAGKTLRKA